MVSFELQDYARAQLAGCPSHHPMSFVWGKGWVGVNKGQQYRSSVWKALCVCVGVYLLLLSLHTDGTPEKKEKEEARRVDLE